MDTLTYIRQLFHHFHRQQAEIKELKKKVQLLSDQLKEMKEKPSVTVERLEYKFDQLKVETLEGTLNIGLNPADLQGIDDVDIPKTPNVPYPPNIKPFKNNVFRNPDIKKEIIEKLNMYIHDHLETVIKDTELQMNKQLDQSYIQLIQEDLRKQIPARTDYYINTFSTKSQSISSEEELKEKIYRTIVDDINQAVHAFVGQLPM